MQKYRQLFLSSGSRGHTSKFNNKVLLCVRQGAVRQAITYADRSCESSFPQERLIHPDNYLGPVGLNIKSSLANDLV